MRLIQQLQHQVLALHLKRNKIPLKLWHQAIRKMPIMQRYHSSQRMQIRLLASEILRTKHLIAIKGMVFTDEIKVIIATQAAIMVYGFELAKEGSAMSWLRNWSQIIVYPMPFLNGRENIVSPNGVLVSQSGLESGETQYQGGIVIDWNDDKPHRLRAHANQVLMHEMAHKLDMLDGDTNGHPPLHADMNEREWFMAFEEAFESLCQQLIKGRKPAINPYAATNPAEFFAVSTEYFFEAPAVLKRVFPAVYHQLTLFYKQSPQLD
ncbi:zinc-dependent peptidase [Thiomicrorhabdus sp. Milos-T2]|uniref:M90 family metallopeptidase n=1 Tax=Thiomicrorhabdus sp. Milos-T2 TaxID=90814 RepID=UPI0006901C69|nr:M90 family metallopeptidase [Thiomicrorhabdus sp. Milos-T2]